MFHLELYYMVLAANVNHKLLSIPLYYVITLRI